MSRKLALLVIVALLAVAQCEVTEEDGVLVLTDDNFDEVVKKYPFVLVEAYAPWCGHCKNLAPEYAAAAQELKTQEPYIPLAKVDATIHKKVADAVGVKGYPTLKWYVNGVPSEYGGGRTKDTIISWIKKKSGPATTLLSTQEEATRFVEANNVAVVFFGEAGSPEYEIFEGIARSNEDLIFAHSFDDAVKGHYGVTQTTVTLFKKFDEGRNDYTGPFTADAVRAFINTNQFKTIIPFDQAAASKIFGEHLPTIFLMTNSGAASQAAEKALEAASKTLKGKILLSTSQAANGLGKRLADYIGVRDSETPTVRLVVPKGDEVKKFVLNGEITETSILEFYEAWNSGDLKPVFKSEEIPANDYDGNVRVLVGKNFEQVVYDETKDVLVEFYAPWCGHCKSLAPIYEKVAARFRANPNIVIAKMDSTGNEVEGINISGFPTLKFFPTNRKRNPLDFNGGRDEKGFETFLKEKATVAWVDLDGAAKTEL